MISRAANRTSSERPSSTSLRPSINPLSFSRVRSDAGILSIGLLPSSRPVAKPDLVGFAYQAKVHPNPFSSKLRTSPATFGTLNAAKDNAILVPTWYSGTNKIIEQVFVGRGHALAPNKYFIIIVNQIGGGLSTSPHNAPPPAGMANFPRVRIGDDVRAQHKLI